MASTFTHSYKDQKMKVTLISSLPFSHTLIELFHSGKDHGIKVELDGKIIAYSGDTGITEANYTLAKNADCLIHECTYPENHPKGNWGHSIPSEIAKLAKDSNVKKLMLTHFDASLYTTIEKRKEAEKIARKIFPNTLAATDDLIINL
jgi:ribonuclease Z